MEFIHKPVLFEECMEYLNIKPDGTYVDGTLGGAGHSLGILGRLGECGTLVGIDQDTSALCAASERLVAKKGTSVVIARGNFENIGNIAAANGIEQVDGILLDIGVSSHQLDEPQRGFGYMHDAPLDMRMDVSSGQSAAHLVNECTKEELFKIIKDYGEERWAMRIAEFIVNAREKKKIETTFELVDIIKAAIPSAARRDGPHPAKRTFQALRIAVNRELDVLYKGIESGFSILKPGGRFLIITFHSLEDRIVKNEFAKRVNPCTCPSSFPVCICKKLPMAKHITRKPVTASESELSENPRARSAKLRVVEKL